MTIDSKKGTLGVLKLIIAYKHMNRERFHSSVIE